jgi:hypothetical protein
MADLLTGESAIKIEDDPVFEAPYTRFILANIQLITNGMEISNINMKIFNDSLLKFLKFNMSFMRLFWIPFLSSPFIPYHSRGEERIE